MMVEDARREVAAIALRHAQVPDRIDRGLARRLECLGGEGTPELQRRRALAGDDGDVTATTSVVDLLATRGIISADMSKACAWLRRLAVGAFGRPHPRSCLSVAAAAAAFFRLSRRLTAPGPGLLQPLPGLAGAAARRPAAQRRRRSGRCGRSPC